MFKVGDIIKAKEEADKIYIYTVEKYSFRGIVTAIINQHEIQVKVIKHEYGFVKETSLIVRMKYFELVESKIENLTKSEKNKKLVFMVMNHEGLCENATTELVTFDEALALKVAIETKSSIHVRSMEEREGDYVIINYEALENSLYGFRQYYIDKCRMIGLNTITDHIYKMIQENQDRIKKNLLEKEERKEYLRLKAKFEGDK